MDSLRQIKAAILSNLKTNSRYPPVMQFYLFVKALLKTLGSLSYMNWYACSTVEKPADEGGLSPSLAVGHVDNAL